MPTSRTDIRKPLRPIRAAALLLPALLFASSLLQAQAPHYTAVYSARIVDGQYSGDYDIFGAGFSMEGIGDQPPEHPRVLSSLSYRERSPFAVADREGGMYVAYVVEHTDSAYRGDRDIVLRHINAGGADLWGDSTNHVVPVAQSRFVEENPRLLVLGDGSLIVCYEIHYPPAQGNDVDIATVRISRDGRMLWAKGGWVAHSSKHELLKEMIADDSGGALVLLEARTYRDTTLLNSDVMAQRIDSSGATGWKDSHDPVPVAASPYLEMNPVMVPDGNGGMYVAYQLEYNKGPRAGDLDILAQHLTRYGSRAWVDEKNPPIVSSNAKARELNPAIARDSTGIVIAFEMTFTPTKSKGIAHVIGMQRLDSAGHPSWNDGKRSKLISVPRQIVEAPKLYPDVGGGVYVLFDAMDTVTHNRDIYAQRIGPDGEQIWGDGERAIPIFNSPDIEANATAAADNAGGLVIVATRHPAESEMPVAIIAQRINANGDFVWTDLQPALPLAINAPDCSPPVLVRQW
ncbi:MAG TPA: hypothetical protein VHI13_17225 [Candidatus Kapabacteria bacterium]|nr:hypothetical protein [Candidatus Kapabacteria bacterium]